MLSSMSRTLTRLVALLFALLGAILFVAPEAATRIFLWSVSPFVTMTIGAFYLGSAVFAWEVARTWRWPASYAACIYLWALSLLEAGVLILHSGALRLNTILAWGYLATIGVSALVSVTGIVDWARRRPPVTVEGPAAPRWIRLLAIGFAIGTSYIALTLLSGAVRGGTVWPGQLTVLSARAFGALYLALALATIPLIGARSLAPIVVYARAGLIMTVLLMLAAFAYLGQFNFAEKPSELIYLGAYLMAAIMAGIVLLYARSHRTLVSALA